MSGPLRTTEGADYTARLLAEESASWKRWLPDRQAPSRWNLRRLEPGYCLDVGCGIGRNLANLGGNGVGIDHNPSSVAVARQRGFEAFEPDAFRASPFALPGRFDSLLFAHVLEHLSVEAASGLLRDHLPYLTPGGKVIIITPQEWGQRADPTHVTFMDGETTRRVLERADLEVTRHYSFPFPRWFGRLFRYNEFVTVGRRATPSSSGAG